MQDAPHVLSTLGVDVIQIVVPMAGRGQRFRGSEREISKPMIEVLPGRRMIDFVIRYLTLPEPHHFTFVALAEHDRLYNFQGYFAGKGIPFHLEITEALLHGPADSGLLAEPHVDPDDELLVAYCDSFHDLDIMNFIGDMRRRGADGGVLTYPSDSPFDSYADIDASGLVMRTAEKQVISPYATAGLYYFRRAAQFFDFARALKAANPPGGPELFVCPVFNFLIAAGGTVWAYPIDDRNRVEMGTPVALARAREWMARSEVVLVDRA